MALARLEVVDVDMIWRCSLPEAGGWTRGAALAAVAPVTAMAPAAATALPAASSLLWEFSMTDSFLPGFRSARAVRDGVPQTAADEPGWGRAGSCRVLTGAGDRDSRARSTTIPATADQTRKASEARNPAWPGSSCRTASASAGQARVLGRALATIPAQATTTRNKKVLALSASDPDDPRMCHACGAAGATARCPPMPPSRP